VKGWNAEMDLQTDNITSLAIWVQFPDLDLKYWGVGMPEQDTQFIGNPLENGQIYQRTNMHQILTAFD